MLLNYVRTQHLLNRQKQEEQSEVMSKDRLFLPFQSALPLLHPSSLAALGYRQWQFWACELEWHFLMSHNVLFCGRAEQTQCLGFLFLWEQQRAAWSGDGILSWGWEVLVLGNGMESSALGSFCWATGICIQNLFLEYHLHV